MRIGVIGAGGLGTTLTRKLAERGHDVKIANSSGPAGLADVAADLGATPASVRDAVTDTEIIVVSIPTIAVPQLPTDLFADVADDVIVVDTCNYHPELRDGRIAALDSGTLDSDWVAAQLGRPVIKAFNNILATSLHAKGTPRGTPGRIALSVAGDDPTARTTILELIDTLGFDPLDLGPLSESWRQQPGAPAYCQDLDAAGLRTALDAADPTRVAEYLINEENRIKALIAAQTP